MHRGQLLAEVPLGGPSPPHSRSGSVAYAKTALGTLNLSGHFSIWRRAWHNYCISRFSPLRYRSGGVARSSISYRDERMFAPEVSLGSSTNRPAHPPGCLFDRKIETKGFPLLTSPGTAQETWKQSWVQANASGTGGMANWRRAAKSRWQAKGGCANQCRAKRDWGVSTTDWGTHSNKEQETSRM